MIRVIIERYVKPERRGDAMGLLRELRSICVKRTGYLSGETLFDYYDRSLTIVISTWANLASWKLWEQSDERKYIYDKLKPLLTDQPTIRICTLAAIEEVR